MKGVGLISLEVIRCVLSRGGHKAENYRLTRNRPFELKTRTYSHNFKSELDIEKFDLF